MNVRKLAVIAVLVFSSFAANNVAPAKAELESMYDKAFRDFNANDYSAALKSLDAIDARQPDLAESQNLRGVILMRQGVYDQAETALQKALATDPKFWNARFNLAEIPFLRKDWAEARKRFQGLLEGSASELQGEASQLIQYKILLTYLLEGKDNMVDSMLARFELSPDTPATHYANAAVALEQKNQKEASDLMAAAQKKFSPQLNKLFAESLYEVGWLEKPAGQTRAALELTSAADRQASAKAFSQRQFEQAEQAFQQRDYTAASKLIDEANATDPHQAPILNLRGEILLAQKDFEGAESTFKEAAKADPKSHEAQFNLAQVPFKKKEYAKARERYEALFNAAPAQGNDRNQAAQLLKFKIYLTFLLEGKDSRAQKMMEQFQFTGDTPALYYAQAAWEFKHNNQPKANDWVASAKKIYSPAMNLVFADAFYDLGWLQNLAAVPATAIAESKVEASPSIEPSPISATALASNQSAAQANDTTSPESAPVIPPTLPIANKETAVAAASPVVETPPLSSANISPAETQAAFPREPQPVVNSAPATAIAPSTSGSSKENASKPTTDRFGASRTWVWGSLLVAGILLLAWVMISEMRRRLTRVSIYRSPAPAEGPSLDGADNSVRVENTGGPRHVSVQLRASEPSVRRTAVPFGKSARPMGGNPVPVVADAPAEESVTAVVESEAEQAAAELPAEPVFSAPTILESQESTEFVSEPTVMPERAEHFPEAAPTLEQVPAFAPVFDEIPLPHIAASWETSALASPEISQAIEELAPIVPEVTPEPVVAQVEKISADEAEPVAQGQPIPYQVPAFSSAIPMSEITKPEPSPVHVPDAPATVGGAVAGVGAPRQSVESPSFAPQVISTEPLAQQSTTAAIMPQPNQPSQPTPAIHTNPMSAPAPQTQPVTGMQTAVQLTFSFEIASLQLTPSFKMGGLQLKPTSKIVTMRLAPSQQPQPAMNLQVTFEVATVQLSGGALGTIRLTPSQQQRPSVISSPSFNISSLQLLSGAENGAVQLTPSQQGQASVHVTGRFQIASVEFSPSFEIASLVLNSTTKSVSVQLPGAGPSAIEGAPVFDITNVQLAGNGEIGMMQLAPQGSAPRVA
ncbi:MAG: tetratricopeptide repeat protein [Verrucomicrobiota bacterium]